MSKRVWCVVVPSVIAVMVLFVVCSFGLTYTLTYDCLISDPALYRDLTYLTDRGDCAMQVQAQKRSITIGTGSDGAETPDQILKRISDEGGLVWRDYAAGLHWEERVEDSHFKMVKITVEPSVFLNTKKLTGAEDIHWGIYCRFCPWLRCMFA